MDWQPQSTSPSNTPHATGCTAVVCTRHRPEQLRRALASLLQQTESAIEILAIDNAPESVETRKLIEQEFPSVRYVREPRQGLDFARNRALREAHGRVVAFLDDDAVAHRTWIRNLRRTFRESAKVGLCTGPVEALDLRAPGQRLFEANGGFSRGMQRIRLPRDAMRPLHGYRAPLIAWAVSIGCGTNYAVRREVALQLGGFDEALDLGDVLPGGGDHDLLWRMLQAGYDVIYEPEAMVWHEHRASEADALRQIVGHQRALMAMLVKSFRQARGRMRWSVLAFLLWRLLKPGMRLIRRTLGRDPVPAASLFRMWWHCLFGLTAYHTAQAIARERRTGRQSAPQSTVQ